MLEIINLGLISLKGSKVKEKLLFFSFFGLVTAFTLCMFVKVNGFNLYNLWFSMALFVIGLYAIIYSCLYKLDSMFYYGMLNLVFSVATAINFFNGTAFNQHYPLYIFCFAFAHFAVFVKFRQFIHFKIFAFFLVECILLTSYKLNFLSFLNLCIINGAIFVCVFISAVKRLRKNLRRE